MKGNEIRSKFLSYFEKHGHRILDSSSLVPKNDPTLLFTNAGMVQFKTVFMGEDASEYVRAVTSQRCVRAGGKHNDLENVGYTARHHTFFEMLGNFSFGDYFKEDAIAFAWEFLTKELQIPTENLWVSIYDDDDEAQDLWEKIDDLPPGRIVRMGEKDNFWAMGDTGPCGPCSEIHIDQGVENGCGKPNCALGCDCDRFLELWNLVFMQYNRSSDGDMTPLPHPSIDTGMGLERVAAVLQGKFNNYESDLFTPILERIESLSGKKYGVEIQDDTPMRVIADHARATTFLVADGVLPSNEGRGYVLRRIMRRAVRYGKQLGLDKPFLVQVIEIVIKEMVEAYPHISEAVSLLEKVVTNEEERFGETLENGLLLLDGEVERLKDNKEAIIPGSFIFKLYDTYGFPFDVVRDICFERGVGFDEAGFLQEMERQREKSRQSRKGEGVQLVTDGVKSLVSLGAQTEFVGYNELDTKGVVLGLLDKEGLRVGSLGVDETGQLFSNKTPFYAESGGQLGDSGVLSWDGGKAKIITTSVEGEKIVLHSVVVQQGMLSEGDEISLTVDQAKRKNVEANHTATHLLHAALKNVLGDHVKQAGSLVGADRLRFDFTHFSPVTPGEIEKIEDLVNSKILENQPVLVDLLTKDEAISQGATALFGEKYDDTVRVVSLSDFSKELCGGTHVNALGEIGIVKILSESGIASGVRRIEALAGSAAWKEIKKTYHVQEKLNAALSANSSKDALAKVEGLLKNLKAAERQIADLSKELASQGFDSILDNAVDIQGVKVVAAEIVLDSPKTLREVGDKVRDSLKSGVAVLGGNINGKAALLAIISKDLTSQIKAGDLVNRVAKIVGGKGGGRPDMAQAGGAFPDKLAEAISEVPEIVQSLLSS